MLSSDQTGSELALLGLRVVFLNSGPHMLDGSLFQNIELVCEKPKYQRVKH